MTEPFRVLLIKANQHLCEELVSLSGERGWDFSYTLSGADGIDRIGKTEFDIIVVDAVLPDISGFSVLSEVRRLRPDAAVIIISGSETIADTLEHLDRQVVDYLIKPVTAAELAAVISKAASTCGYVAACDAGPSAVATITPDSAHILKHLNAMLVALDRSGRIMNLNRCAETVSGYKQPELAGKPFEILLASANGNGDSSPPPWGMKKTSGPSEFTRVLKCKDGSLRRMIWRSTPFLDEEGAAILRVLVGWEESARGSLESEVARQGRYLAEIIDNAPEAVFTVDSNGVIESWNRGAQEIFGFSRSEAIGRPVTMLVPESLQKLGEPEFLLNKIRAEDCLRNFETERVTKQGQAINVDMTLSALRNNLGEFAGNLTILRDVTERKFMERTLLRTEKLATVGQMAAHLAHEVRNPLNSVILNLDLIRDEFNDYEAEGKMNVREATSLIDAIQKEIIGLTEVTNEYLEFTRTYEDKDESVSINRQINEIIHFYEKEISGRAIEVTASLEDNLPLVLCRRHKIKQALLNIIKNSIDAMPDGGLLDLKTRSDGHYVVVSIRDSGGGLQPGSEEKIFHPFHTTKQTGTGLGLSYAIQVVQHHHGNITFDNRPGEGVTFSVRLPFEQVPMDEDTSTTEMKKEESSK
ncbi:MAG: PAS domain S-box protein [Planctomycetota bacterium]|jgi:two-component system NtrC family sensor kinase